MRVLQRISSSASERLIEPVRSASAIFPSLVLILSLFIVLYAQFLWKYGWNYRGISDIDLPTFYTASVSVFRNGGSPYDTHALQQYLDREQEVFPYLYPPPSLFFFYPLSALSYGQAHKAVLLFNHLLFLLLLWGIPLVLIRPPAGDRWIAIALCLVIPLTFFPVYSTLAHGQVNFLLLAFLVLFWVLGRMGQPGWAALFLALAIVLKTYPLLLVPMLLLGGRRKEGLYTAAWLGLALIASLVFLPVHYWQLWLTEVVPAGGYAGANLGSFSPADISNHSLNGFFSRTFTENEWTDPLLVNPPLAKLLTVGSAILIVAITGITSWNSRRHTDRLDRILLVSLPAMYLIAPFSWEHHLVYLLPVILMLPFTCLSFFSPSGSLFLLLWLGATVLCGISDFFEVKFFAVVLIWVLSLTAAWKKGALFRKKDVEDPRFPEASPVIPSQGI